MQAQNTHLPNPGISCSFQTDDSLKILLSVQNQLIHSQDVQSAYRHTLERLATLPQVSRVAIVEASRNEAGELLAFWEAEWWSGHPPSRRKRRAGRASSIFHNLSSSWLKTLEQGDLIVGTRQSLPTAERERLQHQGIFSILIVPIRVKHQLYGAIRFEHVQEAWHWTDAEISLLQGVALALSLKIEGLLTVATAVQVEQVQDECAAAIAHELRSPLANIQMVAQLLEISLEEEGLLDHPTSPVHQHLQTLQKECQRKNNLINDLLALSNLDFSTQPLVTTPIPLQIWVPYIAEVFQERLHTQQQRLQVDIPADLPALHTDMNCLERILTELLHNACKYTPARETISIVAHCPQHLPGWLEMVITNTGVRIPAHDLSHIFDKFYRVPHLDVWSQGGTGLGLPIVKKLVRHLGATIQVSSVAQQVQLTLRFPLEAPMMV